VKPPSSSKSRRPARRRAGVIDQRRSRLLDATLADGFAYLGAVEEPGGVIVRAFAPGAEQVACFWGGDHRFDLERVHEAGVFEAAAPFGFDRQSYHLAGVFDGAARRWDDPFRFSNVLDGEALAAWRQGQAWRADQFLGAHCVEIDAVQGVRFAVFAPHAKRVAVVGDFNAWDNRRHPLLQVDAGVWALFVPGVGLGQAYKFEVIGADGARGPLKSDPFAKRTEMRPATASVVATGEAFSFTDQAWMEGRAAKAVRTAPISVYEVHAGSWRRAEDGGFLSYDALAESLSAYVAAMGFTHVQFLPLTEHPYDPSWGYQPTGLFAPTSRFGAPEDFARLVDHLHSAGIGVFCDFVPAHFPTDTHGLARFDGQPLYEDANPKRGFHPDWNTCIYDWGRPQVANFLIASALFWIDRFHIDGLRVDAVSSMLYLDYSRGAGEWEPNIYGGNINLEAMGFIQKLNEMAYGEFPSIAMIAEESTAWPGVCKPTYDGGLGFGYKWNLGWMHDTLKYMGRDPIHRRWHHDEMTFGMVYAFNENFMLALSHDEVVHGKGSLWDKMAGSESQKFDALQAYYAFMWAHPGKKLLFMGGEFAQRSEWSHDRGLDWACLDDPRHHAVQSLVADLNRLYRGLPALHEGDCDPAGFAWVQAEAREVSIFAFLRWDLARRAPILAVFNFTPVERAGYRVGVPIAGAWRVILNTTQHVMPTVLMAEDLPADGLAYSVVFTVPGLSGLYLGQVGDDH
jgi:1,4-alpha-glucan branching enzyme